MSCYVVDYETISVIVKGFEMYGVDYEAENYVRPIQIIIVLNELRNAIGQSLLDQNYKSVNYRYNEDTQTPKFEYKDLNVNPGMILGCIECYEYQACETDGYFNSAIHWSLVNLKEAMLKRYIKNDGYKIPYGYDGHNMIEN